MWRWRPEPAGPALGRVGLGWLEVVGRVVGSGKASAMESLWKVVGAAKHGGGPVAAMARQLPSALATLGQRVPSMPVALGTAAGPVGAGGPKGCCGRWRRLSAAAAA